MKITSLTVQEKHKDRCNIFVDGEFYKGITIETAMQFHLKVGLEIDEKTLKEIIAEGEKKDALNKAINYISKALKTKSQVKTYLLKKEFSLDAVWYAIDKLKEYGYIDDKVYATRYIESTSKTQGKKLSAYKLMSKGVKKEDIECAYEQANINSKEDAYNLAVKRLRNKEINTETLSKTYRYLLGRGFSYDEVDEALSKIKEDL
ncbi:MAG: RecX family transcriptional regulator [Clostridia bacterium]|nr:RecX family transcriptional regulator [Clostridia bacterium]